MEQKLKRKITVVGHRDPNTDSICSAVCYTSLKRVIIGDVHISARAGYVNGKTRFVLGYFGMKEPKLVKDVRTQVKDIGVHKARRAVDNISLKKTWNIIQGNSVATTPPTRPDGTLEGSITAGGITKTYTNIYDSSILSKAHTRCFNIIEALEADVVVGSADAYSDRGKVLIAAANPGLMEFYAEPHDLIMLGSYYESQLCAIEMGADCIVACEGAGVSIIIKKIAQDRGCTVVAITYGTYTAARLVNQNTPVSYFMTREHLITFSSDDYTDEVREVMVSKRHRNFPILDKEGRYLGMISRRNLLGAKGKQVILVNCNKKSQTVAGIEGAEVMEIINHHRLGTVQTMAPMFFRNQLLGCTATIIYQIYPEDKAGIEPKIARLLCSVTVLDILSFRFPACTPADETIVRSSAAAAELDIREYVMEIFGVGSSPKDKSDEGIFYQGFKKFSTDKALIGVGQITSLNDIELGTLKEKVLDYVEKARGGSSLNMVFFMLTSILKEFMDLICCGQGAMQLTAKAFHLDVEETVEKLKPVLSLPGVVFCKKQLIPELMLAEQDQARQGQED